MFLSFVMIENYSGSRTKLIIYPVKEEPVRRPDAINEEVSLVRLPDKSSRSWGGREELRRRPTHPNRPAKRTG